MYKFISGVIILFLCANSASAQVSSQATISATITNPVGVEVDEGDESNKAGTLKVIGMDQSYSISIWNDERNIALNEVPLYEERFAVRPRSFTVNFE